MHLDDDPEHQHCAYLLWRYSQLLAGQIFTALQQIKTDISLSSESAKNHVDTIRSCFIYHRKYHESPGFLERIAVSPELQRTFDGLGTCYDKLRTEVCDHLNAIVGVATPDKKGMIVGIITQVYQECLSVGAKHSKLLDEINSRKQPSSDSHPNIHISQTQILQLNVNVPIQALLRDFEKMVTLLPTGKREAAKKELADAQELLDKDGEKKGIGKKIAEKLVTIAENISTKAISELAFSFLKQL